MSATLSPMPMPVASLPPPPANVTDALTALRVVCAQWAPHPGPSDHQTEIRVCNAALDRDTQFSGGIMVGVAVTLTAVALHGTCRSTIKGAAIDRFDEIATYALLALLALPIGLVIGSVLIWNFGDNWNGGIAGLAIAACVVLSAAFLALLRRRAQANRQAA